MAAVDSGTVSNLEGTTAAGVTRPPPLTQTDAITSLLSLSLAAAAAGENSTPGSNSPSTTTMAVSPIPIMSAASVSSPMAVSSSLPKTSTAGKHHRRLASTGQTKRRLSDAREAGVRPVLALPVTAAAGTSPVNANPTSTSSAALSLASLSLSTSPSSSNAHLPQSLGSAGVAMGAIGHGHSHSYSSTYGYSPLAPKPSTATAGENKTVAVPITIGTRHKSTSSVSGSVTSTTPAASTSANGKPKKRGGIDYICESCAKVYRHPNCLNKHRWEHTAQWREASKFVLSKHQQVQLLEAATILSHMAEGSSKAMSLPEDRSEWPSYLSGGKLPKVGSLADEEGEEQTVEEQQHKAGIVIGANANVNGTMPPFGSIGRAHVNNGNSMTRTYALQPHTVTVNPQAGNGHAISASVPSTQGPRMYDYAGVGVARATHVAPGLVGVPNTASNAGQVQVPRNYSGSGSSASRSRSRSASASASNSNGSDVEVNGNGVEIEVDVVGEDVDEDEVDGMSLDGDGEENVKQKTTPAASAAFTYSPYYPNSQQTTSNMGQSPGGFGYGSYGSYGSGFAGSYGTPSSTYGGAGFSSSFSRRGGSTGLGMKREDDEMSIGFSVREEDEEEEEGDREEEEEEDPVGGAPVSKKFGPVSSLRETSAAATSIRSMSTRRSTRTRTLTEKARGRTVMEESKWDGMEMEVDNMDMD